MARNKQKPETELVTKEETTVVDKVVNEKSTEEVTENLFARPVVEEDKPNEYGEILPPGLEPIEATTIVEDPEAKWPGVQAYAQVRQQVHTTSKKLEEVHRTMSEKHGKQEVIFYYGFYSVNHPIRKGELMEPLHSITGETRKCPCNSIAIKLENVVALCENGYILKNLDRSLFRGRSISKRNISDYVEYITNMIENGFLSNK